jgi:hypothetical protein
VTARMPPMTTSRPDGEGSAFRLPPAAEKLDAETARRVGALVAEAERRQAAEIASALERALSQVPGLLRPLLRKALGL